MKNLERSKQIIITGPNKPIINIHESVLDGNPGRNPTTLWWEVCPPLTGVTRKNDLTGVEYGELTVQGLWANGKGRWVVQCHCGRYEVRTAKAIKNPKNNKDSCDECKSRANFERTEFYHKHGYDIEDTEMPDNIYGIEDPDDPRKK